MILKHSAGRRPWALATAAAVLAACIPVRAAEPIGDGVAPHL